METGSPSPVRRAFALSAGLIALAVAVATGLVAFTPDDRPLPAPSTGAVALAPGDRPVPVASTGVVAVAPNDRPVPAAAVELPSTPFDRAAATLRKQAAALTAGDEEGWLAAVDPAQPRLVARYRGLYRSLRALGVSHFAYHPYQRRGSKGSTLAIGVSAAYCLSVRVCPRPPRVEQALTLRPLRGAYLITGLSRPARPSHLQPTPWESGDLVFAHGRRVTVAATPGQAKHLKRVLAVAEKAAAVNDRYASYVGNPQLRYRLYLADDKAWKSWYGGIDDTWTVAYAVPLSDTGTDVVLRMSELRTDRRLLATTVQHELGHVVTVGGVATRDVGADLWLSEGIAEWIGWAPKPATDSWRRAGVRSAMRKAKRPTTIAAPALRRNAGNRAGDRFYGLAHFAVDCMAQRYGERRLFEFVRLTLRRNLTNDKASRAAYGVPFATVDKQCLSWIRKTA